MPSIQAATNGLVRAIDRFSKAVGDAVAWLTLAMVAGTCIVVLLRYGFGRGAVWLQETVLWMHAAVFMLGAAATLAREEHVRVDVFYRRMGPRAQAFADLCGLLFFLFPLCAWLVVESFSYVAGSWALREGSRDAGGLPYPFLPLLKTLLIVMPLAVALQGTAMLLRSLLRLAGR